jgi:hypothetical protein
LPATNLTVLQILKDKPVTIKSQCQHSENDVRAAVILVINSGAKLLAEYKRPTVEIVIATTNLILSQYSHLCIDDVRLCIQNLCSGLYGEIIALDFERYGKALKVYSEEKRVTEVSYQTSNQFPKNNYTPTKMPIEIKEGLSKMFKKAGIAKPFSRDEKPKSIVIKDWRTLVPNMDEQTYQIWEWFDEKWNEQGCTLKEGCTEPLIEYNEKFYTRGEFTKEAKALINQSAQNKIKKQEMK